MWGKYQITNKLHVAGKSYSNPRKRKKPFAVAKHYAPYLLLNGKNILDCIIIYFYQRVIHKITNI